MFISDLVRELQLIKHYQGDKRVVIPIIIVDQTEYELGVEAARVVAKLTTPQVEAVLTTFEAAIMPKTINKKHITLNDIQNVINNTELGDVEEHLATKIYDMFKRKD